MDQHSRHSSILYSALCTAGPLLAVTLMTNPAIANPCAAALDVLSPSPGAQGLPTNTRIWVDGHALATSTTRLLDSEGQSITLAPGQIDIKVEGLGAVPLHVLTPAQPLRAHTHYRVVATDAAGQERELTHFHTSDAADQGPPEPLDLLDVNYDGIGQSKSLDLDFDAEAHAIVLVHFGEGPKQPSLTGGHAVGWAASSDHIHFTDAGDCGRWPEELDHVDGLHFGQLDAAGHFSGWSETKVLEQSCSINAPDAGSKLWLSLGLVALLGLRRKRPGRGLHRRPKGQDRATTR